MSETEANPPKKSIADYQAWLFAGMAAASFVAVTQLATRPDLYLSHHIAIGLFALALPICVVVIATWKRGEILSNVQEGRLEKAMMVGSLAFCLGIIFLFGSFNPVYGVILVVSSIVTVSLIEVGKPETPKTPHRSLKGPFRQRTNQRL